MRLPPDLWPRLSAAPSRLLALDLDGTLAPFRVERSEARPLPECLAALRRIATSERTHVAVVSGRPFLELARLLRPLRATLVGEHGWALRDVEGHVHEWPLPAAVRDALAAAGRAVEAAGLASRLERKRASLVLHVRGMVRSEAAAAVATCSAAWRGLVSPAGLRLDEIDGGLELRARGRDKGTVLLDLLDRHGHDTAAVYVGDDTTDEDAFRALDGRGYGLLVAARPRPTAASGRLASCAEVAAFLQEWLVHVEGETAA